jgi:hypothetical protein
MTRYLLRLFHYVFLIFFMSTLFLSPDAYCFFGFSSKEKNVETEEQPAYESSQPLEADQDSRDYYRESEVTEPSRDVQQEVLAREEQKIEELQEIQSSFIDKMSIDPEISDEEVSVNSQNSIVTEEPSFQSDSYTHSYSSSDSYSEMSDNESAAEEKQRAEVVQPVVDEQEEKTAPSWSFFGNDSSEKEKAASRPQRSQYGTAEKTQTPRKAVVAIDSQKANKVKFCKTCGREYDADDPRLFCMRDGTPLKLKNK